MHRIYCGGINYQNMAIRTRALMGGASSVSFACWKHSPEHHNRGAMSIILGHIQTKVTNSRTATRRNSRPCGQLFASAETATRITLRAFATSADEGSAATQNPELAREELRWARWKTKRIRDLALQDSPPPDATLAYLHQLWRKQVNQH